MNRRSWIKGALLVFLMTRCAQEHHQYTLWLPRLGQRSSQPLTTNRKSTCSTRGRLEEVPQHFEQAVADNPRLAQAHYNLGLVLYQLGNTADARRHHSPAPSSQL